MKNVFLKSLKLYYFKGTKKRTVDFKNHQTDIAGPNGSGKTTIFDAFTWLLFGKDSHDRKDFNIKTLESDGINVEKIEHTVEGVLSVDGEDFLLKRVYKENWVKKRGELEPELKGHETLFYINEVPRKAGEYQKEINDLIDESIFKLITNPRYFANLNWVLQREILFNMAGEVSNEMILDKIATLQNKDEIFNLTNIINSGKKLELYKLEIRDKKKKLNDDLKTIPTRIDEAENAKPTVVSNYSDVEKQISDLSKNIESIDAAIENSNTKFNQLHQANQDVQNKINNLKSEQQGILFNAGTEKRNEENRILNEKRDIENKIKDAQRNIQQFENSIRFTTQQKQQTDSKILTLREKYKTVFESKYTAKEGVLTCPVFNIVCDSPKANELHKENSNKAEETFNTKRVEELQTINTDGIALKNDLAAHDLEIENVQKDIDAQKLIITDLEEKLSAYSSTPSSEEIKGENLPEWVNVQYQINIETKKIKEVEAADNSELKLQKVNIQNEITDLQKTLNDKSIIERQDQRITELNAESRKLSQLIADLEKDEFVVDAFNRAKIEECESRINGKFKFVSFKLFEKQLNGGENETCEMLIDGVPYSDANTASQINAGLDVINVLSAFHGVTAPIFIDNRESVTNIIETESQIVNLLVSNDKEL